MRYLFAILALFAVLVVADAGPICNLARRVVHKATHPLESFRENRAERRATPQATPQAVPQALPKGPADCPNGNCPIPQKKTADSVPVSGCGGCSCGCSISGVCTCDQR